MKEDGVPAETAEGVTRIEQLDSLRGLAALSVVFLHFQDLFFPYDRYGSLTGRQKIGLAVGSLFTQGHLAVLLFFALSGFVLALGFLSGRPQPYPVYALRRVVRIYLPYLLALAVSVAGAAIFHGHLGLGEWAEQMWSRPVSAGLVLQHVLFLGDYDFLQFNVVFWTLVYEMRISLVFPVLVRVIERLNIWGALLFALLCSGLDRVLTNRFPTEAPAIVTLDYLGVFVFGILLAKYRSQVSVWYRGLRPLALGLFQAAVLAGFVVAGRLRHFGGFGMLLTALGLMILAIYSERWCAALNHRVLRYLGRISYSLYLVHAPILFTLIFLLNGKVTKTVFFPLYLAAALTGGSLFYWAVESPCVRMARGVGKRRGAARFQEASGAR